MRCLPSLRMPDHDRRAQFVHPLGQDFVPKMQYPICPGFRVTYYSDCTYCDRELIHQQDSKINLVKVPLDTKIDATSVAPMTQLSNQPITQGNLAPKDPRASKGRVKMRVDQNILAIDHVAFRSSSLRKRT